jgi:hypothetical protein
MSNNSAQRQFLVTIAGVAGTFAGFRGGETTSDVTRDFDGGSLRPDVMTGPASTADIRISRGWRRDRDIAIVKKLRPRVGRFRTTITVQPLDEDLVPAGAPDVYSGVLSGLTPTEVDANSGNVSRLELVFAVEDVR